MSEYIPIDERYVWKCAKPPSSVFQPSALHGVLSRFHGFWSTEPAERAPHDSDWHRPWYSAWAEWHAEGPGGMIGGLFFFVVSDFSCSLFLFQITFCSEKKGQTGSR